MSVSFYKVMDTDPPSALTTYVTKWGWVKDLHVGEWFLIPSKDVPKVSQVMHRYLGKGRYSIYKIEDKVHCCLVK